MVRQVPSTPNFLTRDTPGVRTTCKPRHRVMAPSAPGTLSGASRPAPQIPQQPGEVGFLLPHLQLRKLRLRTLRGLVYGDSGPRSSPDPWATSTGCPSSRCLQAASRLPSQLQKPANSALGFPLCPAPEWGAPHPLLRGSHRLPLLKPVGATWCPTCCPEAPADPE